MEILIFKNNIMDLNVFITKFAEQFEDTDFSEIQAGYIFIKNWMNGALFHQCVL